MTVSHNQLVFIDYGYKFKTLILPHLSKATMKSLLSWITFVAAIHLSWSAAIEPKGKLTPFPALMLLVVF